ncbi:ligand-binding sensor domain-containing diguanylate cyclase [Roseateles violae]|uniref:diguanylate cyclase n=1 Tax=Roseateles violae TaxID=3058042 RepID=A0ABT8DL43_9BURK|nr:ligand-binding sensor domain-containing diguanylate cyclase [Pelomonas sp. PFR6]MDN3919134.1 diguanylate cyclase [Pelomonas sp. PFR6]
MRLPSRSPAGSLRPLAARLAALLLAAALSALGPAAGAAAAPGDTLEVQFRSVQIPQNTAPTLAQDKAGFIWVATSKGLTRYDGYRLRPIERQDDAAGTQQPPAQRSLGWVRALAAARDGRMWIGTEFMGLMVYDAERDRVEPQHGGAKSSPIHTPIRALAEDADGAIWVGTVGQGLFRYRPGSGRFEQEKLRWGDEPESRVLALCVASDGSVWAGHWRGLARRQPDGEWETLPLPGREASGAPVLALAEDRDGRLWLGTQDGRLGVYEKAKQGGAGRLRWVQQLGMPVQALAQAADGRLWVGTKVGLLWVDPASGEIEARLRHDPRRTTSLAGNDISGLLRDRSGAMWVTGYGLGLQRHQQHAALAVRGADVDAAGPLAEPDVRALLSLRNGEVLAPTQLGRVVRLDGRPGHGLASLGVWPRERTSIVESLAEAADGSIWLAGGGRLERRSADGRLLRDWPLDGGRAQRLLLRANGEVWLGMQEGLYKLAGPAAGALQRVHLAGGAPLHGGIYALIEAPAGEGREAELWVGGQQGLFREQGGAGRLETVTPAPDAGLSSPIIIGLLRARDGTLWIDQPVAGLSRLLGWDGQGRARFERIGERLGSEGVFGGNLHEDAQGRIWSQLHVYDPRSDRLDGFGAAEGASFGSFWFFASAELPGGALLFGGSRGLLRVEPGAYKTTPRDTPLLISALRVNGQPYQPQRLHAGLTLPAGTRTLGVEFAGLDFAEPERLRYQYRLQGLDADWTTVDASARSPSFGPLKPGRYLLQVRAAAPLAPWGPPQLELPIERLPAWWETLAAQLAGAALLLLALWAWVRWRTRRLRRREVELQALVDARTAELREASITDALTGLRNRRYLELRLQDDLRLCLRRFETATAVDAGLPGPDSDLLVMLLDLDHFKRVNDAHGHAAGDAVLVQLAARLRRVFRETDALVRWGGEEVLVLVRETNREEAAELAERACAAVREQPFDIGFGQQVNVSVSIGFAAFPLDPRQPRAWDWQASLALADSALYAAKAQGRDGFVGAVRADGLTPREAPRDAEGWQTASRLAIRRSSSREAVLG